MIRVFEAATGRLAETAQLPPEGWIDVDDPSDAERARLEELGVRGDLVAHALDLDELPRAVRRGQAVLVVVRRSEPCDADASMPYRCVPLGIVLLGRHIVTIGRGNVALLSAAAARYPARSDDHGFVLGLFVVVAEQFLRHLAELDRQVDELEEQLWESHANLEVRRLLRCQRSLMVFARSLEMNEDALASLRELLPSCSVDREVLDDALTETRQAKQLASTSGNLLSAMLDAFTSIVSNNLNQVVRLLSALAVVLVVPPIVGTFYGMNVRLPFAEHPGAFWIVVVISVLLTALPLAYFRRRRWL